MARLVGCRVLVTRPEGRADALLSLLAAEGARVGHVPLVRTEPPVDPAPLRQAARRAWTGAFKWLVVTSPAGARALADELQGARPRPDQDLPARWCAVGPATAQALRSAGHSGAVMPEVATGASVPGAMEQAAGGPGSLSGVGVLAALADRADPQLVEELRHRGARVERVTAYRTVTDLVAAARAAEALARGDWDLVVVASPSAVEALAGALDAISARRLLAAVAIGPTTARAAGAAGWRVEVAAEPTPQAMVEAACTLWGAVGARRAPPDTIGVAERG